MEVSPDVHNLRKHWILGSYEKKYLIFLKNCRDKNVYALWLFFFILPISLYCG